MQLTSPGIRLSVIIAVSVLVAPAMVAAPAKPTPTLVEVVCGGDDALTLRLRDTLETAFKLSSDFRLSSWKEQARLLVTIPTHVGWEQVGRRTRVLYTVEFASLDNQNLGTSTGSCWDNKVTKCASQIVKDAKIAARKIH